MADVASCPYTLRAAFGHHGENKLTGYRELDILNLKSTVCTLGLSSSKTGPLAPPIICHSEAQRPQPDFSELGPLSPQLPWLSLQSLLASSSGHPTCLVLTSSTCSCFLPQKHKDQYGRAGHCWRVGSEWETKSLNFQPTQGWAKLELLTD